MSVNATPRTDVDVAIVGAGLSGIGAARRLQQECPDLTWTVLESRDAIGGTWDLFRYPGVRSDSDMYTLGYAFRPWRSGRSLADGESILKYIRDTAAEYGIDDAVRFHTRVVGADFDTTAGHWTLTLEDSRTGERSTSTCRFLYLCAGYYDYETPHDPQIAGLDRFAGEVLHPQFWPQDFEPAGKRVVVIGSGATAVTLVPSLLEGQDAAAHVTMLQRTPTWIAAVPGVDRVAERIKRVAPPELAHHVIRAKNIAWSIGFYEFCQRFPRRASAMLTRKAAEQVGSEQIAARDFTAPYKPWDQRLCAIPSGDLFRRVRDGSADVVTARIDEVVPEGVRLTTGEVLPCDVIVPATGLKLKALGGLQPSVDGQRVALSEQFAWNGAMVSGLPNFAFCIGYTNASWTLRADLVHRLVCQVLNWMGRQGHVAVVPTPRQEMERRPLLDLAAGYIRRNIDDFPHQGDRFPWTVRQNYLVDSVRTLRTNLDATLRPVEPQHQDVLVGGRSA